MVSKQRGRMEWVGSRLSLPFKRVPVRVCASLVMRVRAGAWRAGLKKAEKK